MGVAIAKLLCTGFILDEAINPETAKNSVRRHTGADGSFEWYVLNGHTRRRAMRRSGRSCRARSTRRPWSKATEAFGPGRQDKRLRHRSNTKQHIYSSVRRADAKLRSASAKPMLSTSVRSNGRSTPPRLRRRRLTQSRADFRHALALRNCGHDFIDSFDLHARMLQSATRYAARHLVGGIVRIGNRQSPEDVHHLIVGGCIQQWECSLTVHCQRSFCDHRPSA